MVRLQEHNSGYGSSFTMPIHRRPWSLAAFAYNFTHENDRLALESDVQQLLFIGMRIDNFMLEFKRLTATGVYGNIVFCCCGQLY